MTQGGNPDWDMFDDVVGDNDQAGIYDGAGLRHYENVSERTTPEGPENKLVCRLCGKEVVLTPSWEEIFYVAQNGPNQPLVLPAGWWRSDTNFDVFHTRKCPRCGEEGIHVHYDPENARALVKQAVQMGFIQMGQLQQWKQKIAANLRMG
jgi:hypothetical protein